MITSTLLETRAEMGAPVARQSATNVVPRDAPRTAREVIDEAIRENRGWDTICRLLVVAFATAGLFTLVFGAFTENGLVSLSGAVGAALFWPALRNARSVMRTNISIRLLELTLANAKTAEEAARAIKVFFSHFKADTDVDTSTQAHR